VKTLVLGATTNETRYANIATKRLLEYGHEVVLLGNKKGEVSGHKIMNKARDVSEDIDTVTMYLGEQNQTDYEDFLLNLNPRRVIFNPGAENHSFAERLRSQGVETLDACTLVMLSTNQF
jgi:predicted CoA-binding protein